MGLLCRIKYYNTALLEMRAFIGSSIDSSSDFGIQDDRLQFDDCQIMWSGESKLYVCSGVVSFLLTLVAPMSMPMVRDSPLRTFSSFSRLNC